MKKIVYILFLSILLISCNSKEKVNVISTVDLKELISKETIQLVDVRTTEEIQQGSIKNALFINYFDEDFSEKAEKVLDKNKPVYLYCRSGNRSNKAAKLLNEKGFVVINIEGGYNQWKLEN